LSAVIAFELLIAKFENGHDIEQMCKAIGLFLEYAIWMKLHDVNILDKFSLVLADSTVAKLLVA